MVECSDLPLYKGQVIRRNLITVRVKGIMYGRMVVKKKKGNHERNNEDF